MIYATQTKQVLISKLENFYLPKGPWCVYANDAYPHVRRGLVYFVAIASYYVVHSLVTYYIVGLMPVMGLFILF